MLARMIDAMARPPAASAPTLRALVVDDHPIVIDALATALVAMRVFQTIDAARSLDEATQLLRANPHCSLVILDLHLAQVPGQDTLVGFRERFPDIPVIIFSGDGSLESIAMAFEHGARGYVSKNSPIEIVTSAIRIVLAGSSYVPPDAMRMLGVATEMVAPAAAGPAKNVVRFSGRQEQVFRLLMQGMPNKVIASRLDMAEGTAKAHLNSVYRILGVRTRVEAVLRARQLGIG